MKKFLVAYGVRPPLPDTLIQHMALFDLLDTDYQIGQELHKIKAINPNLIALAYKDVMGTKTNYPDWPVIDQHEDWFLHDVNGARLQHRGYGWYAMDVGNQGWRQHYVDTLNAYLNGFPWDGIFADDVWVWTAHHNTVWTVDQSLVPPEYQATWISRMTEFLQHVKPRIGGKLLVINPNTDESLYINEADGFMIEGYVHPGRYAVDEYHDNITRPKKHVDDLAYWSKSKIVLAYDGCTNEDMYPLLTEQLKNYCLNSFRLGEETNAYFGWNNIYRTSKGYFPNMDTDIGSPTAPYYIINPDVYGRRYTKAIVLVNFSPTQTYHITIDEIVYELLPHSGLRIEKPAPISPIKPIPIAVGAAAFSVVGYLLGGKAGAAAGAAIGAALGQLFG